MKKIFRVILIILSIAIGLYPSIYFIMEMQGGLLESKSAAILSNTLWNIGFYSHISLGGFALLIGWIQFSKKIRTKYIKFHRWTGRIYVISAIISGIAAVYIGFYATGGIISSLGFISLGLIWLYATTRAYLFARGKQFIQHEKAMYFSYAACFAAVTLRIWLPILISVFGDFIIAYRIVSWLCWIPNILVAYWLVLGLPLQEKTISTGK